MHGNVCEWCQDDFHREMTAEHQVDPLAAVKQAADAVLRGGGWYDNGQVCRSAFRYYDGRDERDYDIGLRLAQVL